MTGSELFARRAEQEIGMQSIVCLLEMFPFSFKAIWKMGGHIKNKYPRN